MKTNSPYVLTYLAIKFILISDSDSDYWLWVFIFQEELKIANLVHSIQTEEEILSREKQLSLKLEKARIVKVIYRYSICWLFTVTLYNVRNWQL